MSVLRAIIRDVVPLGPRVLLSVQGLTARPALPCCARVLPAGDRLTLLEQPQSPTLWLLSEVTLLAEPQAGRPADWTRWVGHVLEVEG